MNKSIWTTAAALLVLAGCAGMDRDFEVMNTRHTTVDVVNGVLTVGDDPVDLFANNGAIRWVFGSNPDGYVFPADGIKFDRRPSQRPPSGCLSLPDPDLVFNNCKPLQRGAIFQCAKTGPHVVNACYKYDIKVELPGGGRPIVVDPWAKLK
jgi:hypothetical protein